MANTRPSLGPFPADSGTYVPAGSTPDLAHSETISVARAAVAPSEPVAPIVPPAARRSRAPVIAGALALVAIAAGGYIAFGRGGHEHAPAVSSPATPSTETGSASTDSATTGSASTTASMPPQTIDAAVAPAPDAGSAAETGAGSNADTDATPVTSTKTVHRPPRTKPKPPVTPDKPPPTLPPTTTGAGSNDKLPF